MNPMLAKSPLLRRKNICLIDNIHNLNRNCNLDGSEIHRLLIYNILLDLSPMFLVISATILDVIWIDIGVLFDQFIIGSTVLDHRYNTPYGHSRSTNTRTTTTYTG